MNADGVGHYCKFHFKTAQGIKNLSAEKAAELEGKEPDYAIRDLYNAIAKGDFPSWNFFIQVMTFDDAEKSKLNPFDVTKVWSQKQYPLIPVGKFTLDRNPKNYFAEVEQLGFAPSNLVPGIEPSPDRMLQGRLLAYSDTQRHRIGANHMQLPVNCPYRTSVKNYQRDGPMNFGDNQAGAPNYFPNSFEGNFSNVSTPSRLQMNSLLTTGPQPTERARKLYHVHQLCGDVNRVENKDGDDFSQSTAFWNTILDAAAKKRLVVNLSNHLINAQPFIQERAIANFFKVSTDLGNALTEAINLKKSSKM